MTATPTPHDTELRAGLRAQVAAALAERHETLLQLSHGLHDDPELAYEEHRAVARIAELLRAEGIEVEVGSYGLPTAFQASVGHGDLNVVLCAEYDALPKIGHACGHNIIATAAVGAMLALAPVADAAEMRVTLLGTPAEEHGGGKVDLLRAGAWEEATCSMMVHPAAPMDVACDRFEAQAVRRFAVTFTGRGAHAAGAPELGINAGAAATLALVAMGLLRQHLPTQTSINAFVEHGGDVTNIIPDHSVVQVEVRALDLDVWRETQRRVLACFEGAAIATGCGWSHEDTEHAYEPLRHDPGLARLWDRNLAAAGRPFEQTSPFRGGSTDMGNVSQVVPAIHPSIALKGSDSSPHQPGFAAAARSELGDAAALDAGLTLAWTALDVALDEELRADLLRRQAERPAGATTVGLPD